MVYKTAQYRLRYVITISQLKRLKKFIIYIMNAKPVAQLRSVIHTTTRHWSNPTSIRAMQVTIRLNLFTPYGMKG